MDPRAETVLIAVAASALTAYFVVRYLVRNNVPLT